jgi:DNA-binding NtrC family response regulator
MYEEGGGSSLIRILFVDDDQQILRVIARLLRRETQRWHLTYALGGKAGIEFLREHSFDIVVTDLDMPLVNGMQVLDATKTYCPKATRILMTGSPVDPTAVDADAVLPKLQMQDGLRELLARAASSHRGST